MRCYMKITKEKDIALLLRPFGVRDGNYLAVGAMLCFDLIEPWRLCDEQALWRTVESELGPGAVLDAGMPKLRSEFLAAGKCYTPRESTPVAAAEVVVGVGGRVKKLFVHGERYWTPLGGILRAEGFTEMALSWSNAFGGKGFAGNPGGKGIEFVRLPGGRRMRPLPNIEDPSRLMGSPDDRPEPAGFGPLDPAWPQRKVDLGTYDTRWRRQRWPNPPDDFDYAYYNTAPADQQFDGFYTGEELIEIRGMHPDHQLILSDFPPYRIRCFLTRKQELWNPDTGTEFVEVPLHAETLWLFPAQLRGVVLLRGTAPVLDDEYKDVVRIFLAKEGRDATPQSREYYQRVQEKALDRSVKLDPEPQQQAEQTLAAAMKQVRNLPKDIARVQTAVLGRTPVLERKPREYARMAETTLAGTRGVLDTLGSTAAGLRTRLGFLPGMPLQAVADKLNTVETRFGGVVRGLEAQRDAAAAHKQTLRNEADGSVEHLPGALRANAAAALAKPEQQPGWRQAAFSFAVRAVRALEADQAAWGRLRAMGFADRTIRNGWLGLQPRAETPDTADWGLDPAAWGDTFSLPSGLVAPWFRGKEPAGVAVGNEDGETLLPGSETGARLLPAAAADSPVVVAPGHLQGLYLEQEIGDACHILIMRAPDQELDQATGRVVARSAEQGHPLLVVFPERTLKAALDPWRKRFENARALALPKGMNIFAAKRAGTDTRAWCMTAFSQEFARRHALSPECSARGMRQLPDPLQGLNIRSTAGGLLEQGKERFAPLKAQLAAKAETMLEQTAALLTAQGQDPDAVLQAAREKPRQSLEELGEQAAALLAQQRGQLAASGRLTPDLRSALLKAEDGVREQGAEAGAGLRRELQRLESGKQDLETNKALAQGLATRLASQGLDPERMRRLSSAEVRQRLRKRESLAGARMSGLDLSGMNFSGCDLSGADLRNADLSGARFDHADLSRVLGQDADCSKAVFRAAKLDRAVFSKADFTGADLRTASCARTLFIGANLREINAGGATFDMAVLQDTDLTQACFSHATLRMCSLTGARATRIRFDHTRLVKSLLRDMVLDDADFGRARVLQSMLWGVRGRRVSFLGADLTKARLGGNSVLQGADFTGVDLLQGCFRESDLRGALFRGARLDGSLFESCSLVECDFYRSKAKKTRFTLCDLEYADMRAMNLLQGSLRKSRLVRTNLGGSNLFGVDFYKAVISGSEFKFANLKRTLLQGRTELLDDAE